MRTFLKNWTAFWHKLRINQSIYPMLDALLLLVSALLCFALFYKTIEWFERF